jgi:uncharacterized membrane protein
MGEGWAEARCWVLRNRANPGNTGWIGFSGSLAAPMGSLRIVVGVVVWLGPALTKLLVVVF